MNLVKELQKVAKKNYDNQIKEAEQILDSVKANLEMEDTVDREMLRFFGTAEAIPKAKTKLNSAKKFIDGSFVTVNDIKKVCLSYHLRFLRTEYYKKEIPLHALNDLRKFKEQNNISERDLGTRLYIIAPASHFLLGERPKNDPILLYAFDNNNYKVVSTWGSDFVWTRKIVGFFKRNSRLLSVLPFFLTLNILVVSSAIRLNDHSFYILLLINLPLILLIPLAHEINALNPSSEYWDVPYFK